MTAPMTPPEFFRVITIFTLAYVQLEALKAKKPPLWMWAHAALNASPTGMLILPEIANFVLVHSPGLNLSSTLRSLQNNLSISPDFMKLDIKDGRNHFFCLTGTTLGVPRMDKTKLWRDLLAAGIVKSKRTLNAEMRTKPSRSTRGAERRAHNNASAVETSDTMALPTIHNLPPPAVVPEHFPVSFTPQDFLLSPPVATNNVFGPVVPAMMPDHQGPPALVLPQEIVDFIAYFDGELPVADAVGSGLAA